MDVVFIDPAYFALRGSADQASNYLAMGEILSVITEVSRDMGVTCLVTTHNKRAQSREFSMPELEDISYPGFAEWARQWILLGHRKPWEPNTHQAWLWMNVGGYEHSGSWAVDINEGADFGTWVATVVPAAEARRSEPDRTEEQRQRKRQEQRDEMVDTIKTAFRSVGTPQLSDKALARLCGTDPRRKGYQEAVGYMLRSGELETVEIKGKNNKECDGYRRVYRED